MTPEQFMAFGIKIIREEISMEDFTKACVDFELETRKLERQRIKAKIKRLNPIELKTPMGVIVAVNDILEEE